VTFVHAKNSRFAFGSSALAAYLTSVSTSTTVETADSTDLTATTKNYVAGLADSSISCAGLFEPLYDTPVKAALAAAANSPVTVAPDGFAVSKPVLVVAGRETAYEIASAVGAVVSANITIQGDGQYDQGVSLADLLEVTAGANGSTHTDAAGTSNGGIATLHVTACTGTLTVKVQHSTNNSTWADLATFTAATAATSERIIVAPATTVNRYLRASWTLTGAGAAATFTTSFARR